LERKGIPWEVRDVRLEDVASFRSAFVTNSATVAQPIATIDNHQFVIDQSLTATLKACYETNPWEAV
jgi:branched-subunit amino acid aminotransferase/4-amino-4-deoxychorismate lyase